MWGKLVERFLSCIFFLSSFSLNFLSFLSFFYSWFLTNWSDISNPNQDGESGGRSGEICHWAKLGRGRIKINGLHTKNKISSSIEGENYIHKGEKSTEEEGENNGFDEEMTFFVFLGQQKLNCRLLKFQ